jgi:type II secretory pathway predicted ATPase ExeA
MSKKQTDRKTYKKVPIEDRIQMVERLYINFPRNQSALNAIGNCHSHAKLSKEPEGILILGDTGAGKTTVVKLYMRSHPRIVTEEVTVVPVLYATVPVPATCKSLVTALLTAIGDPAAEKGSQVTQTLRLKRYIGACKVELLILDEFQHFQDRESLRVLKTISDWLKVLMDETGVPMVLAGLPYSHTVLDDENNEQLRRRFALRIELAPFGFNTSRERQDFRRFLSIID